MPNIVKNDERILPFGHKVNHSFLRDGHEISFLYSPIKFCIKRHKQMIFEFWGIFFVNPELMTDAQKTRAVIFVAHAFTGTLRAASFLRKFRVTSPSYTYPCNAPLEPPPHFFLGSDHSSKSCFACT